MSRFGEGPSSSRIMLVGDFLSPDGHILSGAAGAELNRMLHEAGILRSECYCTNVVNDFEPPHAIVEKKKDISPRHIEWNGKYVLPAVREGITRLFKEIELVQPNVIVALGNLPLWVLSGAWGILKWRGSQLKTADGIKLIPVVHPTMVMRQWEFRAACVFDLKRAAKERGSNDYINKPKWNFIIKPSYQQVMKIITMLLEKLDTGNFGDWDGWIDFDYETRTGHIACAGFSWSRTDAISIPFMTIDNKEGYWTLDEEATIVYALYKLLTHPRVSVRGQNLLYDAQYSYRHWHFVPRVKQDTMISWHTMFAGLPKRLDYQASILCDYFVYWKEDHKSDRKAEA